MDPLQECQRRELQRLQVLHDYDVLDSPPEAFFDDMVYLAALTCRTPIALITLVDMHRQWFKAKIGIQQQQTPREFSVCNHVLETPEQVLVIKDATRDPRVKDNPYVLAAPHMRFYAGAPLVTPEGYVLGTLCVIDTEPRDIGETEKETLRVLARRVVEALGVRRDVAHLEILSATDPLTGLWNRRAFEERLAQEVKRARRYHLPLSLALFDVDNFKRFNDVLGHQAGDRLLQSIARAIRRGAREIDQESRFGGDEFALILPNTTCDVARQLAERLRLSVSEEYGHAPQITLSVGVAELGADMHDSYLLLGAADRALYEAKHNGRNQVADAQCGQQPMTERAAPVDW